MKKKETNLETCKNIAKALLYLDVKETEIPLFVTHPFFNSRHMPLLGNDKSMTMHDIIADRDSLNKIRYEYQDKINIMNSIHAIMFLMNKPYRATYFKLIRDYLSEKDYGELLSYVWTDSENPNQDTNVSIPEWISFFKKSNKRFLMEKEDYQIYNDLPDDKEIIIYRGVAKNREPFGLSWTANLDTATWFAKRFSNDDAYVLKAKCFKKDILAFFNTRGENELVTDIKKIFDIQRIDIKGE